MRVRINQTVTIRRLPGECLTRADARDGTPTRSTRLQEWATAHPSLVMFAAGILLIAAAIAVRSYGVLAAPLGTIGAAALLISPFAERLEGLLKAGPVEANLGTLGREQIDTRLDDRIGELPESVRAGVDLDVVRGNALASYAEKVVPIRQVFATSPNTVQAAAGTAALTAADEALDRILATWYLEIQWVDAAGNVIAQTIGPIRPDGVFRLRDDPPANATDYRYHGHHGLPDEVSLQIQLPDGSPLRLPPPS
jgi:hypothetical protein